MIDANAGSAETWYSYWAAPATVTHLIVGNDRTAAQPERRRGPQQRGVGNPLETSMQLLRRDEREPLPRSRADHPDQLAEGRVAERRTPAQLAFEEALAVVARGGRDRARVGRERL